MHFVCQHKAEGAGSHNTGIDLTFATTQPADVSISTCMTAKKMIKQIRHFLTMKLVCEYYCLTR